MSQDQVDDEDEMYVTKRNGKQEIVSFDKILTRIKKLGKEANIKLNYTNLGMKVIDQLYSGISTTKIDELSAEQCASMASIHPDYNTLAGRIIVSNHHKNTDTEFSVVMQKLYDYRDKHNKHVPLVTPEFIEIVHMYKDELNSMCDYERDYLIEYFGFKTLERAYLFQVDRKIVERPQHMWLRVAVGIHGDDIQRIRETYNLMSRKFFTHATPTLFNAGTPHPQLSSCYLLAMENDSIDGIYNTLKDCALISKWAGGIGLHIHNVRASGSHIRGTNGASNGIVPMLKVFNNTAKYVDQCVVPETTIYTTTGPMEIQDCIRGETEIINMKGEIEQIGDVLEHPYNGELLSINTMHSIHPLKITPEHPVLAIQGQQKGLNHTLIKNRLDKGHAVVDWIEAKELNEDSMVGYAIPVHKQDVENISTDDCYMYGVLLGDGSMNKKVESTGYVSLHTVNKKHIQDFLIGYFESKCVNYDIKTSENTTRVRWNRCLEMPHRYQDVYNVKKEKRIASKWLNLPLNKIKQIVKGLIHTDGCIGKEVVYDSTSLELIEGLRYLLLRMGILTSGYVRDRVGEKHMTANGMIENKKISYCLRIPKTEDICNLLDINYEKKQFVKFMTYKNMVFTRVQQITSSHYEGVLYDLQMSEEHNYMIHNGLIHNGGGKRNGSFAIYLEPWHADIEHFLQLRKNHGDEEMKARDLFYALWIPDLFMERVKDDGNWTLMCPDECPGLADVHNDDFVTLYESYEASGQGRKTMKARDLWFQVLDAQMETGTPYLCYKDSANRKSNQQNIGTIKSSNLCVAPETLVLTDAGPIQIQQLKDQTVNVWNGFEFSEVIVYQTGVDQPLLSIETDDGSILRCTHYHRFFIKSKDGTFIDMVEANNLKPGDILMDCDYPVINWCMKEFAKHYNNSRTTITDGYIYLYADSIDTIREYKCLLQGCGINVSIQCDILNSKQPYIEITPDEVHILYENGFSPQEWKKNPHIFSNNTNIPTIPTKKKEIKIKSVVDFKRTDNTFCFTEPNRNSAIFNGMITSQCSEIIEYSDEKETAVCNLASIALPAFVNEDITPDGVSYHFDYAKLHQVTKVITYNLNRIIDINFYPTDKTKRSNLRHRPIGIGVQGLADVFMKMGMAFCSNESKQINRNIFETIYHAALEQSCEIAQHRHDLLEPLYLHDDFSDRLSINEHVELSNQINSYEEPLLRTQYRGAYSTFCGSPASQGKLQFDLWNVTPSNRYDWDSLKQQINTYGLRNSLLVAPMPTASTSQILGYNECIEPITSNIYNRRTIAGEFILANKYLMHDLLKLDLWNENIKNNIIANNGSIQHLDIIPIEIREKYKTVWEIPMKQLIDMAADRGAFVCQSQSLNLWLEDPNYSNLTSMHFYSWSKGLKTGIYYLRRRARHQAQQFTIEPKKKDLGGQLIEETEDEICEMCSA
jgi:ribonucleotide reductase alpha subunit